MRTKFKVIPFVAVILLSLVFALTSHAVPLTAMGPRDIPIPPGTGFPLWYQDSNGLSLGHCLDSVAFCGLLADGSFNPQLPLSFPGNFPFTTFYYLAETPTGTFSFHASIQSAFGGSGNPADGQQAVFSRIRIRADVDAVGKTGTYTVTHPYGAHAVNVATVGLGAEINETTDIFGVLPLSFEGPLNAASAVGPFLRNTAGNVIDPATGNIYLANPAVPVTVTGSPFGTNFVEIRDPDGIVVGRSDLFKLAGKVVGNATNNPPSAPRLLLPQTAQQACRSRSR